MFLTSFTCSSVESLRKSGSWQTSHSRITASRDAASGAISSSSRQDAQRHGIAGGPRPRQAAFRRRRIQAFVQRLKAAKVQNRIAPLQHPHRIIAMGLDPLHQFVLERFAVGGDAEGAVIHVAAGAAGDLADLVGRAAGACARHRICRGRRRRHGRHPCSAPCRWRRWRPGNPHRPIDRARPGHCGCAGDSAPSTTAAPPRWRRITSAMP